MTTNDFSGSNDILVGKEEKHVKNDDLKNLISLPTTLVTGQAPPTQTLSTLFHLFLIIPPMPVMYFSILIGLFSGIINCLPGVMKTKWVYRLLNSIFMPDKVNKVGD
jgi:hypothetical protein